MIARLSDSWFALRFMTKTTSKEWWHHDALDGADGIEFWCPCGYGKSEYPLDGARPHGVIVSFANPRGVPPAPADAGSQSRNGGPSRWTIDPSSTGIDNLTLTPSIAVGSPECWHGYITNGEVL